jgi:hypothetical protein
MESSTAYSNFNEMTDMGFMKLPLKFEADLSLGFDVMDSGLLLQNSVNNIFDTEKIDQLGTPPMELTFWISLKYNFEGLGL